MQNWTEQETYLVLNPEMSVHLWDVKPEAAYTVGRSPFSPDKLEATFRVISRVRGQEGGFIVVMCDKEDAPKYDYQYSTAVTPETVLLTNYHITVFEGLILYEAMQRQYYSYIYKTQYRSPSPRSKGKKPELPIVEIRLDQVSGITYMCDHDLCILGACLK